MTTIDLLKEAWQLSDTEKDWHSKLDELALKSEITSEYNITLKISNFYTTHLLPNPWWGNIVNPKIIILALNPSYDPINDEIDSHIIKNVYKKKEKEKEEVKDNKPKESVIIENPQENILNFFEEGELTQTNTAEWWRDVFKKERKNEQDINADAFEEKIGIFQMLGYRSPGYIRINADKALKKEKDFKKKTELKTFIDDFDIVRKKIIDELIRKGYEEKDLKKLIKEYDYKYLPTQNAIRLHVQYLIENNKDTKIIVIWGEKHWVELGLVFPLSQIKDEKGNFLLDPSRVLIVNEKNPFNKNIFNAEVISSEEERKESAEKIKKKISDLIYKSEN